MPAFMNKVESFEVLGLRRNVTKKEMDILNFRKQPSPKVNRLQYSSTISYKYGDNIEDGTSKLVTDESKVTEPKLEPEEEDLYLHSEISDEDILVEQTISSVIFKHEENIVPINNIQRKSRPEVEIKYEDDIEEEYYQSDECSESMNNISMSNDRTYSFDQNCLKDISHIISCNCEWSVEQKSSHEEMVNDNKCVLNFEHESLNKSADSVLLPIVYATINVPFSQVSRFLAGYNLSPSQLSVIRKVRRQVKNRLYAQNCRRRRVAHIKNLADELQQLRSEKEKLCSLKDELKHKKRHMEIQFNKLYQHVMNVIAEEHRNQELAWSDYESDIDNVEDEKFDSNYKYFTTLKRKISEKNSQLKIKKVKLETVCETLQEHIFRVLRSRSSSIGFVKNGIDQPLDLKLNNMNIANELDILNKYYAKNNLGRIVSVDGSRTSENEINDFDYESSDSVCDSRNEKNSMSNDVTEYESIMDGNMTDHCEVSGESKTTSLKVKAEEHELVDIRVIEETGDQMSDGFYESSEAGDDKDEGVEFGDEGDEDDMYFEELRNIREELQLKKKSIQEQYEKLYKHVLEASLLNEPDFLKAFIDHCITLLKIPRQSNVFDKS